MAAARWHAVLPLDLTVRSRVLVGPLHVGRRHRPRLASESVPVLTIATPTRPAKCTGNVTSRRPISAPHVFCSCYYRRLHRLSAPIYYLHSHVSAVYDLSTACTVTVCGLSASGVFTGNP